MHVGGDSLLRLFAFSPDEQRGLRAAASPPAQPRCPACAGSSQADGGSRQELP